ncbi:MAG: MFS transporter [Pseudomonadota bacterium]
MRALLAWVTIVRFGLAQGATVVMTVLIITTIPRIIQNELGFLAIVSGTLLGCYYGAQLARLVVGAMSDVAPRRTPFILAGYAVAGASSVLAAHAVGWLAEGSMSALPLLVAAHIGVGVGVGAAGTTLFALVAATVTPARRAPAATIVMFMFIAAIAIVTILAGRAMTPFSYEAMEDVALTIAVGAFLVGTLSLWGLETPNAAQAAREKAPEGLIRRALAGFAEPETRKFAIFVLVAMFAYRMQELVLEPFLGARHGLDPGQSTQLSGYHQAGVPIGMIAAAVLGRLLQGTRGGLLSITLSGCFLSIIALLALGLSSYGALPGQVTGAIALLGFGNGLFVGGAVAAMFALASAGTLERTGARMGAFGLAQAVGFGIGMAFGAAQLDAMRPLLGEASAFASVFFLQAVAFGAAAILAIPLTRTPRHGAAAVPA